MGRSLRTLSLAVFRDHWTLVARFFVCALGRTATTVAVVFLIREFLAGVLSADRGMAASVAASLGPRVALVVVAAALVGTYLLGSIFSYVGQMAGQRLVRALELALMEGLIGHLLRLPVAFFDRQHHGDILEAVRQDTTRVRIVIMGALELIMQAAQVAAYLGSIVWLSPRLAATALPVFLLAAFPVWALARRIRGRSTKIRHFAFVLSDLLLQVLRGIRIVKVYAGEEAETKNSITKARLYFNELVAAARLRALGDVALETLGGFSIVVVTIVGGFQVLSGTLSVPSLVAFLIGVRGLHGPLNNVHAYYMEVQRQWASVARLQRLLDTRSELQDRPDALQVAEPLRAVAFEGVTFGYDPARPVVRDLTFAIRAGETIGVVGPSGAGKTTLVGLLARFFDPSAGRVLLNDRDLRDYRLAGVHANIALVTQDPFLFGTTIRDNIRYGRPDAGDAEVEAAAREAAIHDDVMDLPRGYETVVGIGGHALSTGQTQRLNIARALLKDAPLLVLDEAMSNLDSITEVRIQDAIERRKRGRTTVVVAHRLSTLRHVDRILVLDEGRNVGFDSHDQLLLHCPLYRSLWAAQQGAAEGGAIASITSQAAT